MGIQMGFRISKRGGQIKPSFQIFSYGEKTIFLTKGGYGPMAPLNTPLDYGNHVSFGEGTLPVHLGETF